MYGEKYHTADYVHLSFQENDLPIFRKIIEIMVIQSIALFQLEIFQTIGINSHLSAYAICGTSQKNLLLLPKLCNKQRYCAHSYRGDSYVYIVMKLNFPNCF